MKFIETFKHARRVSTPLIAVQTADPSETMNAIMAHGTRVHGPEDVPVIGWDIARGFWNFPNNPIGQAALSALIGSRPPSSFKNVPEALQTLAAKTQDGRLILPPDSIVFILQAHRYLQDPVVSQATWNLRDVFKADGQTLVMLCPSIKLPAELAQDVLVLSEPLPTVKELETKVKSIFKSASLPEPSPEVVSKAADAVCGLSGFPAENVLAMSLSKQGLDMDSVWDRKRTQIEQTPGLSVWRGNDRFEDVIDCDNVINFLKSYVHNIGSIVYIDEIEKAMAGAQGDSSGVSQDMHGQILTWMQDNNARGMLFLGHPGTGKSKLAKCGGSFSGKLVIKFDISRMKDKHVGESTQQLVAAFKTVEAVSGEAPPLVIATCNKIEALSPELRRRFKSGTFFFDLPSQAGRKALWQLFSKQYGVTLPSPLGIDDNGWTGAEIETCCELAKDLKTSILQASSFVVPITKSSPDSIASLRQLATGKFISASKPGPYSPEDTNISPSNVRRLSLDSK